jgi:hypothetical protein
MKKHNLLYIMAYHLLLLLLFIGTTPVIAQKNTHSKEYKALLQEAEASLFTTESIVLNKVILVATSIPISKSKDIDLMALHQFYRTIYKVCLLLSFYLIP